MIVPYRLCSTSFPNLALRPRYDFFSSCVSIHEQGKIQRPKAKARTAMMEQYMTVDQQPAIVRGTSPGLAGVADMFGGQ